MKKKIEQQIKREIDYMLAEINIDAEIDKIIGKDKIRKLIDDVVFDTIRGKVSDAINLSIIKAIQKNQPLIDVYTADKVRGLMFKIDEATKD